MAALGWREEPKAANAAIIWDVETLADTPFNGGDPPQPHQTAYSLTALTEWKEQRLPHFLRAAMQLLLRRHAVLRTLYGMDQGQTLQMILPSYGFVVPLEECTEMQFATQAAQALSMPFCLTREPPVRARWMLSDAQPLTRLLFIVDHVAADYASTLIIQKELRAVCNALHLREHPALPSLMLQYADFSLSQRRHAHGRSGQQRHV